ncbi:MarR family winged helix-turn-helix transcriptional regulator [Facklamia miroungae]|uniref:DNA-binding transcriptional regulator, MarR family n=1 Tax=Facklamia miroungae TaxID=120956 RepID=A0A1G7PW75_9LACT|nr:MarR family transcriptional regulator [Facklamia miroungae]NKZ28832.1 MarR family transcriptional regulator [Facklamia miroungae]SDF89849.1 DNA-binding transcriptional regulator, MarR family [Facklamia miroungae]
MLYHLKKTIHQAEQLKMRYAKCHDYTHLDGPQGHVIMYLYCHREKPVFQKDIEDHLKISKSVASNLIQRMKRNGFIETRPYPEDKRHKVIQLTSLGIEKSMRIEDFISKVRTALLENISPEEICLIHKIFSQIDRNIIKANQMLDKKEEVHD